MKRFIYILLFILTFSFIPKPVSANAAEPPGIVVIVNNAPDDLILTLEFSAAESYEMSVNKQGWESYYKFYYNFSDMFENKYDCDFSNATLIVESSKFNFKCTLPDENFNTYKNFMTLNLDKQSLSMGVYPWRAPCLVLMRLTLTILIEGIIFYLFSFRSKKSWLLFFIINLITQGGLNILLVGPDINAGAYAIISYCIIEIFIVIGEMIAFGYLLDEHKLLRRLLYVLCANALSLALGAWIIMNLPI